ncbi:hypothetical protein QNI16_23520 [Cytophagaceae bacterium YF14B1]|uniref:Uncharacterized protein n=1 Tax=Xanthocytophaga flava TaxID=3048013 RepID=A0AAE3QVT3_9BACT|nr:hypothetical protein [Xanthocytophaga flavus]MDJ1483488.1 hypothetical protein [Xanthocytophaga flavus]
MKAFKIKSALSEKQIEADVTTYFGWISPINQRYPFRLLDINESITGADKLYDYVIPIYLQFKVSHGLKPLSFRIPIEIGLSKISSLNKIFGLDKIIGLNKIRAFRRKNELYDNPTLYFQLRERAATAEDFQHNILLKFANTGMSHAFYVAPLTLDMNSYRNMLYEENNRFLQDPFFHKEIFIIQKKWISALGMVPFLRGHISIPPHERVDTHEHYFSFSPSGTDIAWHSPNVISRDASRLSDQLVRILNTNSWTPIESYWRLLLEQDLVSNSDAGDNSQNFLYNLQRFGRTLYEKHEIRQLLILSTKEFVESK